MALRRIRLRGARLLRRVAARLDSDEARPLRIEWGNGRTLTMPTGSTLEQAMAIVARLREYDTEDAPAYPAPFETEEIDSGFGWG